MGIVIKIAGIVTASILMASLLPQTAGEGADTTIRPFVDGKAQDRPKMAESDPIRDDTACSCIKTARAEGIDIPIGTNAVDLKPNSSPEIGALILLSYPNTEHVAKILAFTGEGFLVTEGNFKPCERGERIIYYIDPFIRGFWTSEKNEV